MRINSRLKQQSSVRSGRRGPTGLIRERVNVNTDVYTLALERVERCYQLFDHVAVGFSGGKDSTALFNVTYQVAERLDRLPLHVIFHDEEAIPYQTEDYVRRVIASYGNKITLDWHTIPFRFTNACSAGERYWYPWAPEVEHLWVRPRPSEGMTTLPGFPSEPSQRLAHYESNPYFLPLKLGRAILLMGVRAEESMNRQNAILRGSKDAREAYITYHGWPDLQASARNVKGYPIYDWKLQDVWRAPEIFDWDYNEAYDVMTLAGIPPKQQRCGGPFGNQGIQKLWIFEQCFPEIWSRMVDRLPGVTAAARYSRTDLYGFGSVPPKPDGLTWPEYVREALSTHDEELIRRVAAKRVRKWIRNHYRKVTTAIVPDTPHPDTGVSWQWLVKLAMTGDPLEREQAGNYVVSTREVDRYATQLAKYEAELAAYHDRMKLIEP